MNEAYRKHKDNNTRSDTDTDADRSRERETLNIPDDLFLTSHLKLSLVIMCSREFFFFFLQQIFLARC